MILRERRSSTVLATALHMPPSPAPTPVAIIPPTNTRPAAPKAAPAMMYCRRRRTSWSP